MVLWERRVGPSSSHRGGSPDTRTAASGRPCARQPRGSSWEKGPPPLPLARRLSASRSPRLPAPTPTPAPVATAAVVARPGTVPSWWVASHMRSSCRYHPGYSQRTSSVERYRARISRGALTRNKKRKTAVCGEPCVTPQRCESLQNRLQPPGRQRGGRNERHRAHGALLGVLRHRYVGNGRFWRAL